MASQVLTAAIQTGIVVAPVHGVLAGSEVYSPALNYAVDADGNRAIDTEANYAVGV